MHSPDTCLSGLQVERCVLCMLDWLRVLKPTLPHAVASCAVLSMQLHDKSSTTNNAKTTRYYTNAVPEMSRRAQMLKAAPRMIKRKSERIRNLARNVILSEPGSELPATDHALQAVS